MNTMWSVVFDEIDEARRSLDRVKNIHRSVQGEFVHPNGEPPLTYSALDPELLLWVHTTLVDSALATYEHFVGSLPPANKMEYYNDTKKLALLFDVPSALVPDSFEDFFSYMERMLNGPEINVTSTAESLARDILHPPSWLLQPARPLLTFITAALLPPPLRHFYNLPWNERKQKWFTRFSACVRTVLPCLPAVLRIVPQARAAEKRWRRARVIDEKTRKRARCLP
jgi:uncharacterized protein (DUF2236 family)